VAVTKKVDAPTFPFVTPNPLLMVVSPQFITNWTPDLQGPVIQWGSTMSQQVIYDASGPYPDPNYFAQNTGLFLGQPLSLEFRANLNNLIQIQVRACDLAGYAAASGPNPNSVPGSLPFDKTLADSTIFGTAYKTVSFVLTFKFEQDS
jgi:hypothetical protein